MRWLALDDLDCETVLDLFMQAIITYPKIPGNDSHVHGGMMEFARLLKMELEGRLNARQPLRRCVADSANRGAKQANQAPGAQSGHL